MRKTQPSFVVEYKGGRRQKRAQGKSIWGSVDFASLKREVAEGRPPVTGVDIRGSSGADRKTIGPKMSKMRPVGSEVDAEPRPVLLEAGSSLMPDDCSDTNGRVLEPEHMPNEKTALPQASSQRVGQRSNANRRRADIQHDHIFGSEDIPALAAPSVPISRPQLAELVAQNVELKNLLRQKLTKENSRLAKMLERFSN